MGGAPPIPCRLRAAACALVTPIQGIGLGGGRKFRIPRFEMCDPLPGPYFMKHAKQNSA